MSPTWPPDFGVEHRLVEHGHAGLAALERCDDPHRGCPPRQVARRTTSAGVSISSVRSYPSKWVSASSAWPRSTSRRAASRFCTSAVALRDCSRWASRASLKPTSSICEALLLGDLADHLEGEAVGVVETEDHGAG